MEPAPAKRVKPASERSTREDVFIIEVRLGSSEGGSRIDESSICHEDDLPMHPSADGQ
jgi:hypothetical protein